MKKGLTYRDAGVDVTKIRAAQQSIGDIISATHRMGAQGKVISGFGHYAGLVKLGGQTIALHCDGVGTKVLVAQLMDKFDTVGIDCVAMNVNDIICIGAQPTAFIDYIALKQPNEKLLADVARGLV
ncbi:MAG: AIR synthase related protein, partial [Nitrososphaera sp.]